jgi:hypothetical protein
MHRRRLILGLAAAVAALPASAHHGWSRYDADRPLTLTGTTIEVRYEHPHGTIRLETCGENWLVVLAPPSRMDNRGLKQEALRVGETATVVGYPHRTVAGEMRAERITVDGRTVQLR